MSDLTTSDETGIGRACALFGVAGPNNDATILKVAELFRQIDGLRAPRRPRAECQWSYVDVYCVAIGKRAIASGSMPAMESLAKFLNEWAGR